MNSLEGEYSFLTPTWRLPPVGTTSLYPMPYGITDPSISKSTWNNTMYNARYIPPNVNRRSHPQPPGKSIASRTNNISNQSRHPVTKRVQIIDHKHPTPSPDRISEQESQNSFSPDTLHRQQRAAQAHRDHHVGDNKSDSNQSNKQRTNNKNVHEYLHGLSAPDPGSYVNAYKNQRRRVEDEKYNPKSVMTDYKNFVQNGGFGPTFGNTNSQTYEEKRDTEEKRKSYSKIVREVNQHKVEEQKRMQNNGGQQRIGFQLPKPRHRRSDETRSHFLSAQEVRDFERRIKREHDAKCKCSLHAHSHHTSA